MSYFYGVMSGTTKRVRTMRGHTTTGIHTTLKTWTAAVTVDLFHTDDRDILEVYHSPSGKVVARIDMLTGKNIRERKGTDGQVHEEGTTPNKA